MYKLYNFRKPFSVRAIKSSTSLGWSPIECSETVSIHDFIKISFSRKYIFELFLYEKTTRCIIEYKVVL